MPLPPELAAFLPRYVHIESGGNPNAVTGSYRGLFQMGPGEEKRYGGRDYNAGVRMYTDNYDWFRNTYGRDPSPTELYMVAQQGRGGIGQHLANPDAPAWKNMFATGEGQQRGEAWARKAIWGNVPDDVKANYTPDITSRQFLELWAKKVGDQTPPTALDIGVKAPQQTASLPAYGFTPGQQAPTQPPTLDTDRAAALLKLAAAASQVQQARPSPFPDANGMGAMQISNVLPRLFRLDLDL